MRIIEVNDVAVQLCPTCTPSISLLVHFYYYVTDVPIFQFTGLQDPGLKEI